MEIEAKFPSCAYGVKELHHLRKFDKQSLVGARSQVQNEVANGEAWCSLQFLCTLQSESCTNLQVLLPVLVLPVIKIVSLHQTMFHTRRGKTYCKFDHNILCTCSPITFYSVHELMANSVTISTRVMGIPRWHTLHP